jgi:hypothetical protein
MRASFEDRNLTVSRIPNSNKYTIVMLSFGNRLTLDEPSKTVSLKIETSTFPSRLGIDQRRVITSLTADEPKYTNTTAIGDPINTVSRRAK